MYSRILFLLGFETTRTCIPAEARSILCLRTSSFVILPFFAFSGAGSENDCAGGWTTTFADAPFIAAYAEGFLSEGGGGAVGADATPIGLTLNLDIY